MDRCTIAVDPSAEMLASAQKRIGPTKRVKHVAAAGNNGPKAPYGYPAAYPDVIAVTATDGNGFDGSSAYAPTVASADIVLSTGLASTNVGVAYAGSITSAGQTHSYTFSALQGDYVVVSVGEGTASADFTPWIRLVGPNRAVEILGVKLVGVNAENGNKLVFSLLFILLVLL